MDRKNTKSENEGEGNKTADAQYRKGATEFAHSGKVDAGAKEAVRAVDADQGELKRAVEAGRKPGSDDLPKDLEKKSKGARKN